MNRPIDRYSKISKSERLEKNSNTLFSVLWVMTLAFFIQEPLFHNATVGVVIWFPSVLALLLISLTQFRSMNRTDFLILFFAIIQILVICVIQRFWQDKNEVFAVMRYMAMLLSVSAFSRLKMNKKTFDFIFYVAVIIALLFIAYSFTSIANRDDNSRYAIYGYIPEYFLFNLGNPNAAAFYLLGIYSTLLVNIPYRKHRLLLAGLLLALLWIIYKTECRSCMITAIAVTIIFLFFSHRWIPHWVALVCMFLPVVFLVAYLLLYYFTGGSDIEILGKTIFSGREDVYRNYLEYIDSLLSFFFGNFSKAGLNNAHNAPLTIFASFGLVGLELFYAIMIRAVYRIKQKRKSRITTASVACILGFFIISSSEAVAFLGTFPGIVFLNTFFLLANYQEDLPVDEKMEILNIMQSSKILRSFRREKIGEKK